MPTYLVEGGCQLYGSVRLGGAKNVSYKVMIAALLGSKVSRILNFSHISDVELVRKVIESLGAKAYRAGERTMFIDPSHLSSPNIASEYGSASRASTLFLGPLLARFGRARVPLPGGDKIGLRPIDWHMKGLEALGARFKQEGNELVAHTDGLVGARYRFPKNSHTGTETVLLAAVRAKGQTIIENAAEEPEIDDLINFLNNMGARIRRRAHRVIEIEGVDSMQGAIHSLMPDQNEAVSYAVAALATKGDIIVENARPDHLEAFLRKLDEAGGGYEVGNYGIRFYWPGKMRAVDVETAVHPGFKTDWQPTWSVLLTQLEGTSELHETVSATRFQYVPALQEMGAKIELYNPKVAHPDEVYNFQLFEDKPEYRHAMRVSGPSLLQATSFEVPDLRAGATLIIAGMIAKGTTKVVDTGNHIARGYENIVERLTSMGATITVEAQ